jgi:hypothetical protein
MSDRVVTLTAPWGSQLSGVVFPTGTVFMLLRRDVWSWVTPNGSHGESLLRDEFPGG